MLSYSESNLILHPSTHADYDYQAFPKLWLSLMGHSDAKPVLMKTVCRKPQMSPSFHPRNYWHLLSTSADISEPRWLDQLRGSTRPVAKLLLNGAGCHVFYPTPKVGAKTLMTPLRAALNLSLGIDPSSFCGVGSCGRSHCPPSMSFQLSFLQ